MIEPPSENRNLWEHSNGNMFNKGRITTKLSFEKSKKKKMLLYISFSRKVKDP